MTIREVDPAEAAEVALIEHEFDLAVAARNDGTGDQATVEAVYDRLYAARRSYFRLNIWGMGKCRKAMYEVGMAHDKGHPPQFPNWPGDVDPDRPDPESPEVQAYEEAHAAARAAGAPGVPGIPLWKFGSNDGWIVTPEECASAVAIWEAWDGGLPEAILTDEGDGVVWWPKWIEYLRRASTWGGFEVW